MTRARAAGGSRSLTPPLRVAGTYLMFGIAWILGTGRYLVALGVHADEGFWVEVGKSLLFVAISAAIVFEVVRREVRRVAQSLELLNEIVESTTDAVFVKDRNGVYLLCNAAAARFIGRPAEDVVGRTDAELFDVLSSTRIRERDELVMRTGISHTAYEALTSAGVTRTYEAAKSPCRDLEGRILGIVGVSRDVTDRVTLESKLREQDALLREAGDLAMIGGWAYDPVTRQGQWTDTTARIFETESRDYSLDAAMRLLVPESRARLDAAHRAALEHGTPYDLELEFTAPSGMTKQVRTIGRPVVEEGKIVLMRGSIQDITTQKRLERDLRQNEAFLRTLGDNIPDGGIYRYRRWPDGRSQFEFISRGIERMAGVTAEQARADGTSILALAVPEDAVLLQAAEQESMANLTVFDGIFRGRTRTGEIRWFHCRAAPSRQADGSTTWDGVLFDVTARHQAEYRLRQLSLAVEQSPASIVITDPTGAIEYVNPVFTEITGFAQDDVIGMNPRILKSGLMPAEFYQQMWSTLLAGRRWRGEIINRRKNGEIYWESVSISPLRDASGRTTHYIGVKEDITARKRSEEDLRAAEERQRAILNNLFAYVGLLDPEGNVLWVNDAPLSAAGLRRENVLGKKFWEGGWWQGNQSAAGRIREAVEKAAAGESCRFDIPSHGVQGTHRIVDFQIAPIRDAVGAVRYLIPTAIDITERKQAEHDLRVRTNLYAMLSRTNRAVSRCRSAEELFQEVCAIAVEVGRFRCAWVGVPENNRVKVVARAGSDDGYLDDLVITLDEADPRSHGPTGRAAVTGRSVMLNDFMKSPRTAPWHARAARVGFAASAAFPVTERGRVAAVLTVYAAEAGFFTDELVATLSKIAPSLSYALDAFAQERDRERAESDRRASEERFRAFMYHGPMAAWVTDTDGRIEYANQGLARLVRSPETSPVGKTPHDLHAEEFTIAHLENIRKVAASGKAQTFHEHAVRPDGSPGEFLVHKFPLPRPEGGMSIGGIAIDVTDLKRAEDRLRVLGAAIDSSPNAVFIADREGAIRWANPAFSRLSGYELEEILGKTPRLLRSGHQDLDFYRALWSTIATGRVWTGEVIERHKSGAEYTVRQTITPLTGPDGQVAQFVAVQEDVTASKHAEARLRDMVITDPLTGLANRTGFRDRLTTALRSAGEGALHFIDLDRFKLVNDALGHHTGDVLLRQVAERIRNRVRGSDFAARLGGDEFAIIQTGVRDPADATTLGQDLLDAIRRPYAVADEEIQIGASIGVALFPADGMDVDELLKKSDLAMYHAKQDGRGTVRFFTADLEARVQARVTLETEIRRAIDRGEFEMYYQPQVAATGEVVGVEGLIRWQHPTRGVISPADFLPVAEESGLILPMSDWAIRTVCAQGRRWVDQGRRLRVAVNVSVEYLRRGELVNTVRTALETTGLPPELLEIEITENLLLPDVPESGTVLDDLHALGVKLAIDDFGTGYSSLSYLRRLPVDRLKVDRTFVGGIPDDARNATLVRAIIGLGHDLGLHVIAEGVENLAQTEFLRANGCDEFQGYYFGRPVPAESLPALLEQCRFNDKPA